MNSRQLRTLSHAAGRTAALLILLLLLALALLTGCPPAKNGNGAAGSNNAGQSTSGTVATGISVQLVLSDLGLSDGEFARAANTALTEAADNGSIALGTLGTLPEVMKDESAGDDVGLPPGSFGIENTSPQRLPGTMTQAEAEAVLDTAADCELLVLTAPSLVDPALSRIAAGKFKAEAILLLDNDGYTAPAAPAVPVYVVSYDVTPVAFVAGVAAAASSNTGMFIAIGGSTDPDATEWLDAVYAGAKFHTNGAQMMTGIADAGEDKLVSPDEFLYVFKALMDRAGPGFRCNHYLISAGRATPSIMYALSKDPTDGYCLGGWADFTPVRPARFVGCAIKKPDQALRHILSHIQTSADLAKMAAWNQASNSGDDAAAANASQFEIRVGLDEDAVGFTSFDLYGRFNPDSDDIQDAVENIWREIRSGEFDYQATIEKFNR